jgi:Haem-binding domain
LKVRLRKLIEIAAGCVVAFVAVQFDRPQLTNPPVSTDLVVPSQVKQILRNSCYDCHSNETKLLWFDRVVPAYWFVAKDVELGREHLNLSELGTLPPAQQKTWLYEVAWSQQEDEHWFGAKVPTQVKSVEFIVVSSAASGELSYSYDDYAAAPLAKLPPQEDAAVKKRLRYILGQRASVYLDLTLLDERQIATPAMSPRSPLRVASIGLPHPQFLKLASCDRFTARQHFELSVRPCTSQSTASCPQAGRVDLLGRALFLPTSGT